MGIRRKPEETPVTLAAKRSYLGRVYLDWAKYPVVETQEIESGYIVRFRDLRYYDPNSTRRDLLGARVELDRSLNVVSGLWIARALGAQEGLGRIVVVGLCGADDPPAAVRSESRQVGGPEIKSKAAGESPATTQS